MFEKKKRTKPKAHKAHKLTISFLTASHWIFAPKVKEKRKEKEREEGECGRWRRKEKKREKVEASRGRDGKEEKERNRGGS
jgi:hypothetical protein